MTAREYLKHYGLQITTPRVAVVEDLMAHHVHATADEIYQRVNAALNANLSRASVYNILNALAEKHAIRTISIDDKQARYDIDLAPHAHFRCTQCGKIVDIHMPKLGKTMLPNGYRIDTQELYYMGLCDECQQAQAAAE